MTMLDALVNLWMHRNNVSRFPVLCCAVCGDARPKGEGCAACEADPGASTWATRADVEASLADLAADPWEDYVAAWRAVQAKAAAELAARPDHPCPF